MGKKTAAAIWAAIGMALVCAMAFTACGKKQEGPSPKAGGPVKVTALSTWEISDIRPSKNETLVGQWLEKKLNMDLRLVTVPLDGVSTKINALAVSGKLPTILFKTSDTSDISMVNDLGEKGVFLNIMDYKDKVPNYAKYLKDDFIRREMSDAKGNVYGFAKIYSDQNIMYTTPIIREDLLKGSGYSAASIKTIDDLTNALVYLTKKIGAPAWIQRKGYNGFMEKSGLLWNLAPKTFYDYQQDKFTHPILEKRFRSYIEWLKELRQKGVIHPDWAIMKDETWEGLLASNKGAFTIDRMSIIGDNNFSKSFDWRPVDYPEINGKAYLQPNQPSVDPSTAWVINAKAPKAQIDKALEFMNFLYDEKNHQTLTLGFEGKTYTKDNPNTMAGIRWLIQIYGENADNPKADTIYHQGIQAFTRLQTPIDMESFPGTYPKIMYQQIDHIKKTQGGFRPAPPTVAFTPKVQTELSTLETSLNTYFDENVIAFIEGKRKMDTWDAFVQEMKDKGVQKVVDYYNAAYAEYLKR